jgi:hypothetical protein
MACVGMGCPDFDACAKCFPQIRHPRHMFVKVPAVGDLEAVLHGMPHPICDGCGLAIGGQTWMCTCITLRLISLINRRVSRRHLYCRCLRSLQLLLPGTAHEASRP